MASVSMTGSDTLTINGEVLTDLADGDCVDLTYPNDIANAKTGKNGNTIYALNESGRQAQVVIRMIRGSDGDKFLNNLLEQQQANFAATVLMQGEFIKKLGDGTGTVGSDTYIISGGIFKKRIEAKMNVEGNTDQSIAIYTMLFSNAPRAIT